MRLFGVDEVGRGPLAGPVFAAAVMLRGEVAGLADSKRLSHPQRLRLDAAVRETSDVALGAASVEEIDRMNILAATMLAMARAVEALVAACGPPDMVLVDGNRAPPLAFPARAIVGGDACEPAISAASIVAKVARDALMVELCDRDPRYGFARHKGYGTAEHLDALARHGPSAAHRRSFAPVAKLLRG